MLATPLADLHEEAGATWAETGALRVPARFSSLADEYEAATRDVALLDRSFVGRLKLNGADGLDLLDRLSTNRLADMAVGRGAYTVLTSNKGRVMDLLFVGRLEDLTMVLTAPENRGKVAEWIDFYTFTEDVAVEDVTEKTAMLALMGPKASRLLEKLAGRGVASLPANECVIASIGGTEVLVMRTDFAALPAFDVIVPASQAGGLWREFLDRGSELGVRPVGLEALRCVRVEQGVPEYGKELSEDVNPLEAGLLDFISFNKGCYVGQEVVARLNTYQKVKRHLVGLSWDPGVVPEPGCALFSEGEKVGTITSETRSSRTGRGVGLGYVRKGQARVGETLAMESAEGTDLARVERAPATP